MTIEVEATYENGVLKPDQPLPIKDQERVRVRIDTPNEPDKSRQLGTMKGSVLYMAPDFDAPLDDFKDYME
jgi:predicted DNA-binding antitoxin AbrB/MazE fold protein